MFGFADRENQKAVIRWDKTVNQTQAYQPD